MAPAGMVLAMVERRAGKTGNKKDETPTGETREPPPQKYLYTRTIRGEKAGPAVERVVRREDGKSRGQVHRKLFARRRSGAPVTLALKKAKRARETPSRSFCVTASRSSDVAEKGAKRCGEGRGKRRREKTGEAAGALSSPSTFILPQPPSPEAGKKEGRRESRPAMKVVLKSKRGWNSSGVRMRAVVKDLHWKSLGLCRGCEGRQSSQARSCKGAKGVKRLIREDGRDWTGQFRARRVEAKPDLLCSTSLSDSRSKMQTTGRFQGIP